MRAKIQLTINDQTFTWEGRDKEFDDYHASDILSMFASLMLAYGFNDTSIYNGMRYWLDDHSEIKKDADKFYEMN